MTTDGVNGDYFKRRPNIIAASELSNMQIKTEKMSEVWYFCKTFKFIEVTNNKSHLKLPTWCLALSQACFFSQYCTSAGDITL